MSLLEYDKSKETFIGPNGHIAYWLLISTWMGILLKDYS